MTRIMLVDDEENVLKALRRSLQINSHWKVDIFTVPMEALEAAKHTGYEAIVSDYRMPEMNGIEFLCAAKELLPDSVRVILSGQSDMEALVKAINDAQIFRYISKPWIDCELVACLEQGLQHREVLLENRRLAGKVRSQENQLDQIKKAHPAIFEVDRDEDGFIILNEDDY